jgi:hypothetical protein
MVLVQAAMEALVEQQRCSRKSSGCDCLDLYLALNLKTGRDRLTAAKMKTASVFEIQLQHTKAPATLEWRARTAFAMMHAYPRSARIHAFDVAHIHAVQVREYVMTMNPDYYEILAGYDAVRISLNYAVRNLRKTMFDLTALLAETRYPEEVERRAENISRRIFKSLPESEAVASILNQLYGQD